MKPSAALLLCVSASACAAGPAALGGPAAKAVAPETEECRVAADDPGIELYVRNKHPRGAATFAPEKILLYVHGSTYPAETTFDLPLGGISWMEYIAQRGYDVYMVDVRGYGRSTRPPEMSQRPKANGAIVTTDVAIRDVGRAVDFILRRRGVDRTCQRHWRKGCSPI